MRASSPFRSFSRPVWSYPQERGEVQLTYSSRFSKGKGRSSLQTPPTLEYGITDRWQVEVEWNALSRRMFDVTQMNLGTKAK
ncbi:MAG: hypothetical protein H7Z38_03435 [Rubrivivax sp.]|nr:hypothetical protein [Pyrinomonadaceae bacterium]